MPTLGRLYAGSLRRTATAATLGRLRGGGRSGDLPSTTLVVAGVRPEADRLTAYQHLLGDTATDLLPAGFVHVEAFPLAVALMNLEGFPFAAAGLVHIANRVEQAAPLSLGSALDLRAATSNLRPHPKGTQFDVTTDVAPSGTVFDPAVTWRETSTYLARGVDSGATTRGDDSNEESVPSYPSAVWKLAGDTGRRYAGVSGDVNPIHLSGLSARAFGFKAAIAHGMYTAARALSAMSGRNAPSFTWDVGFGSPVYLPSTVAFASHHTEGLARCVVWSPRHSRVHLRCSLTAG